MEEFNISFPISFVKKEERIVVGIATADNIDKSGDIVDFNASLDAFKSWAGNIREMHSPIAVGKAIKYEPVKVKSDDGNEYNAIKVEAYISKGAQDTWEKVLDGTLSAFSIGGSIVEKSIDSSRLFRGKPVNIIKKYRLGELSLVDNPANALAVVDIIKMDTDGNLEYVLEEMLDKARKQPLKDPKGGLTAAGRRHFKQTEGANLKPGVKGPANTPEKMRRKGSFLTRFFTNPSGPMKDEKGRPTRLALSAAAWGEPVPQNAQDAAALAAKGRRLLERYQNTKNKNKSIDDILAEDFDILEKYHQLLHIDSFENIHHILNVKEDDVNKDYKENMIGELAEEEKMLAIALMAIANKYGKFNEDETGIWAGYESPEENDEKEIGVKCSNCVLYNGGSDCSIIDISVHPDGKCRFAVIPDGVVDDKEDTLDKSLTEWFREEWVDISRPKAGGGFESCGRPDASQGKYPKCVPASKAARMTQAEIDSAVRRKRTAESSTRRKDKKPINVPTETNKAESVNVPSNPELYARVKAEAKAKFRVYPSAYANAWLVREYKKRGGTYRMAKEGEVTSGGMNAGIKNPQQGYGVPPQRMRRKNKKEKTMRKAEDQSSGLIDALNDALSNATVLYFSAHRAHWNVEGPDFHEYHSLFNEIYDDIYGSIDPLAENIRKIGGYPDPLSNLEDEAEFSDDSATTDAKALAANLYMKNESYLEMLKDIFNIASDDNEQGIANFIADRIDMHQKWSWQLKSSLKSSGMSISVEEESDEMEEEGEDDETTTSMEDIMAALESEMRMFEENDNEIIKSSDVNDEKLLQNETNYDTINSMINEDDDKVSLFKRFVNWLSLNDIEQASTNTIVEVTNDPQEDDEMDVEILKSALSEVVDQKLANFGTSIKEDVEASVQSKIDELTKSFEADKASLQEKLEATEKALAEQEEQVKAFAKSGAIKKSVDTIDEEEELSKSEVRSDSFWTNAYLPQGLIDALGYKS